MSRSGAGPLAGIRILDLTAVVFGPLATQILGDYGADVIKVEGLEGDLMRANGAVKSPGLSSIHLTINRNKRSVALDLKRPAGVQALLKIAKTADAFVHNMRLPAIERLGLGYNALREIKPEIVYCAATGYQQSGAYGGKPVFDDVVQSACGLVDLMHREHGVPSYVPTLMADKVAGLYLAQAVTAALLHQQRTGEGQYVEVPMFESVASFMLVEHMGGHAFDPPIAPAGYTRMLGGGRCPLRTTDGYVTVLPYSALHWRTLFEQANRHDLLEKYHLENRSDVNRHMQALNADLIEVVAGLSIAECMAICEREDIPCSEIYSLDDVQAHPQLKSVDFFDSLLHPADGATVQARPPVLFDRTPASIRRPAPVLGEHTEEVLCEIGLSSDDIEALVQQGAVR